jgi:branched-chain amino acid transport system ATP-binding protein
MSAPILLDANDIHVSYGRSEAVRGVSLKIAEGQIVTVIGANGAGKTTLLNALMGLLPCTGSISFPQAPAAGRSVISRVEAGICLVPETRDLFGTMTVEDNLRLGAFCRRRQRGFAVAELFAEVYQLFPRLLERRRQLANTLSGGERQMLALGRALMSRPRLLLLDEPSLGLAPVLVKEILARIVELRGIGVSVLLVEQNARAALAIADYAYVLETGILAMEGTAETVARDARMVESYLGAVAE